MSYKMPKKHQVTPLERFMNPEMEAAVYPSRLDKFCDTRHYSPFQRTIQNIGCSKWACAAPDGYEAPSLFKFNSNKAHFYVDRRVHELDCPAEYVADGSRAPPLDQMNITCRISYPPAPFQGFEEPSGASADKVERKSTPLGASNEDGKKSSGLLSADGIGPLPSTKIAAKMFDEKKKVADPPTSCPSDVYTSSPMRLQYLRDHASRMRPYDLVTGALIEHHPPSAVNTAINNFSPTDMHHRPIAHGAPTYSKRPLKPAPYALHEDSMEPKNFKLSSLSSSPIFPAQTIFPSIPHNGW